MTNVYADGQTTATTATAITTIWSMAVKSQPEEDCTPLNNNGENSNNNNKAEFFI